jgi:hypothetical protein
MTVVLSLSLAQTTSNVTSATVLPNSPRLRTRTTCTRGVGACSPAKSTTSRRQRKSKPCRTINRIGSSSGGRRAIQSCWIAEWRTAGRHGRRARSGGGGKPHATNSGAVLGRAATTIRFPETSLTERAEKSKSCSSKVGRESILTRTRMCKRSFSTLVVVLAIILARCKLFPALLASLRQPSGRGFSCSAVLGP